MDVGDRPPKYGMMVTGDLEKSWEDFAGSEYKIPEYWAYYDDEVEGILESRWGGEKTDSQTGCVECLDDSAAHTET